MDPLLCRGVVGRARKAAIRVTHRQQAMFLKRRLSNPKAPENAPSPQRAFKHQAV